MEKRILELLDEHLKGSDFFLVELKISGNGEKITVFLDGDRGITINECARVSRALGEKIEELDFIDHAYTIEVSSPGASRSLKLKRQYPKNVNREVGVKNDSLELLSGTLVYVNEKEFVLKKDKNFYEFRFQDIENAKILF